MTERKTLEERIRHQIGEEGPQLPTDRYYDRIENELERMRPKELLRYISLELEEMFENFVQKDDGK